MKFEREVDLEIATIPLLEDYFSYWSFQVPSYFAVIDFAGITRDNILVGIEYKLKDWRRAIWQAHQHRLTCDFLYILMPKRRITELLKEESRKVGVGVILFDGKEVDITLKPKRQKYVWGPSKKRMIQLIKEWPLQHRFLDKRRELIDPNILQ